MFFFFSFFKNYKQNAKVINSILNLRELALIKQQHCYIIIYVQMAQWPSRLLNLCCESRVALIIQTCLMRSNYFVAQCELKSIQVWWSVIWDFTVRADSWPPNMLLPVDTQGQLLLADWGGCKWGCLPCGRKLCESGATGGALHGYICFLQCVGKVCSVYVGVWLLCLV